MLEDRKLETVSAPDCQGWTQSQQGLYPGQTLTRRQILTQTAWGERIRDKIAASKRKGMWMGGIVPLGYDKVEKQLVVNEAEADLVRHIYTRYLVLGCVRPLKAELDAEGYLTRPRPEHHKVPGNKPFARGALYTILKSTLYVGKINHKGELHDGKHAAILDKDLWQAVQKKLARNRREKQAKAKVKYPSLLAGLVCDDKGNKMSPTYSRRKNRHYPYYISQAVLQYREEDAGSVIRLPGKTLDETVTNLVLELLHSPGRLLNILSAYNLTGDILETAIDVATNLARDWHDMPITEQIPIFRNLITNIVVGRSVIVVAVNRENLVTRLTGSVRENSKNNSKKQSAEITLSTRVNLRRSGIETKLVYPSGPTQKIHNRSVKALQQALLKSLQWNEDLLAGQVRSIDALIERDGLNPRQTHRLRKLAFLAPNIMERIIAGDIPETLTLERLKKDFPLGWRAQREHFDLS
jgi:site-specific DNA recombinase